ncbi:MAG TPA: 30S ribosomal protein S5, partial [Candidatus Paceibacterota bacterium]|nr:30S ribosomal protein S5 [Candidatus Paceibacterota bacterium]
AKALKTARKNAIKIKFTEKRSIPHEVHAKYNSSRVTIFPNHGRGLVSGAAIRSILDIAGVKDVSSKVLSGSKNKLNTARATIKALSLVASKFAPAAKIIEEPIVVPEIPVVEK